MHGRKERCLTVTEKGKQDIGDAGKDKHGKWTSDNDTQGQNGTLGSEEISIPLIMPP